MRKKSRLTLTEEDAWGMTSKAPPVSERASRDVKKGVVAGMSGGRSLSGRKKAATKFKPSVSQVEHTS